MKAFTKVPHITVISNLVSTLKRIEIVNMRRFVISCSVTALLITAFTAAMCSTFAANKATPEISLEAIYVGEGDSLWSIANECYPENTNIRSAVREIKNINGLTTSTIYPGDVLYIPVHNN